MFLITAILMKCSLSMFLYSMQKDNSQILQMHIKALIGFHATCFWRIITRLLSINYSLHLSMLKMACNWESAHMCSKLS